MNFCQKVIVFIFSLYSMTVVASGKAIEFYSQDGTTISGNLFLPQDGLSQHPAIVFINSWTMDKNQYTVQAEKFAKEGYVVLSYSARGWGNSGGYVNCAGAKDMSDLRAALDWLIQNANVIPGRIATAGVSYGAGVALMGIANFTEIKTAVAMSGWSDLFESFYAQGTPRAVWGGILLTSGYLTGRMDPQIKKLYENMLKHKNIDQLAAWAKTRSVINYVDVINTRSVPTSVYLSQNLEDELFQPNALVKFYEKLSVKKHLELNQGIHASAEMGGLFGLSNHVWNNVHRWLRQELMSAEHLEQFTPAVSMQIKFKQTRENLEQWPNPNIKQATYFLSPRTSFLSKGQLSPHYSKQPTVNTISSGLLSGMVTGVPVIGPLFEAHIHIPVLTWLPGTNHLESLYFQSDFLTEKFKMRGIADLSLNIKPTSSAMQLVAYLYDVDLLGTGKLITHGVVTLHNANKNKWQTVKLELIDTAYDIPKGHRIAIGFDTHDTPYGAPTLWPYQVSFKFANVQSAQLHLPQLT